MAWLTGAMQSRTGLSGSARRKPDVGQHANEILHARLPILLLCNFDVALVYHQVFIKL